MLHSKHPAYLLERPLHDRRAFRRLASCTTRAVSRIAASVKMAMVDPICPPGAFPAENGCQTTPRTALSNAIPGLRKDWIRRPRHDGNRPRRFDLGRRDLRN